MYDNFKKCSDYYDLKHYLIDIMNGDVENYDLDGVCGQIQDLYDEGAMSSSQYDDLMRIVEDLTY